MLAMFHFQFGKELTLVKDFLFVLGRFNSIRNCKQFFLPGKQKRYRLSWKMCLHIIETTLKLSHLDENSETYFKIFLVNLHIVSSLSNKHVQLSNRRFFTTFDVEVLLFCEKQNQD